MISGTADPNLLAAGAPLVEELATEPLQCRDVEVLQVVWEVAARDRQAMLPPALHPVNPPAVTWTVLRVGDSAAGAFTVAETRIICRCGVRSRGYHLSCFVDGSRAARVLAQRWGYRVREADIEFGSRAHRTGVVVRCADGVALDVALLAPSPIAPADVTFSDTMHLAMTAAGPRLIQVERAYELERAERGRPHLAVFDASAWGEPRLRPTVPVSAASMSATVTVRPVRYLCRPEVNALEGTERVGS